MASIQEQLKHIRSANDDWYDEHRRWVFPFFYFSWAYFKCPWLTDGGNQVDWRAHATVPTRDTPHAESDVDARARASTLQRGSEDATGVRG